MDPRNNQVRLGREEIPSQETLPVRAISNDIRIPNSATPQEEPTSTQRIQAMQTASSERVIPRGGVAPVPGEQNSSSFQVGRVTPSGVRQAPNQNESRMAGRQNLINKPLQGKIKGLSSRIAGKLSEDIERGSNVGPFLFLILLAGLKDFFDANEDLIIALIQAIPAAGQAIGVILEIIYAFVTLIVSSILYLFMQSQGWLFNYKIKIYHWLLTSLEIIPFVGILPWQTMAVILAFREVKKRVQMARDEMEKLQRMSEREIYDLEENYEQRVGNN